MAFILELPGFHRMFEALHARGYRTVGPTLRDQAIVLEEIRGVDDLPVGWTDVQEAGTYRVKRREDQALFGYAVGPHSWKKFLHPPERRLWRAEREGFKFIPEPDDFPRYAFIGVRACDLQAIHVLDRVFLNNPHTDPAYQEKRKNTFVVGVNCAVAGGTCFCVSMKTGPALPEGFDLALTEVLGAEGHYFVMEAGSPRGEEILRELPCRPAGPAEEKAAREVVENTAQSMGRSLETRGIKELLYQNQEHPRWSEVAERCLSCANCTMACPTCFCTTVEDVTDLTGDHAERWQKWDSCFTMDFTYVAGGGSVRASVRSRYRHWLTHKLATWWDQFDTSGCVGCGRCVTWCPVGIDLTEEAAALRRTKP